MFCAPGSAERAALVDGAATSLCSETGAPGVGGRCGGLVLRRAKPRQFFPGAAECRSRTLCSAGAVAAPGDVDFLRGWTRMRHRSATESCGQESGMERSVNRTPLRRNLRCGRLPRVQMVRRRCAAACCKTAAQGVQRPAERGALSLEGLGYCVLNGGGGERRAVLETKLAVPG